MNRKGLFAFTLVGMMALSSATPVFADTGTPVGFSIDPPYIEYTMTIPTGNTNIATDKSFSNIGDLTVKQKDHAFDSGHKLEVTVNHSGEFTNTAEELAAANKITYALYTGTEVNEANKISSGDKIEFSAADINATNGKSVAMGVAITGDNFATLAPGDYRDTITFTAEAVAVAATLTETQVIEMCEAVADKLVDTTWYTSPTNIKNAWGSFADFVEDTTFTDNNDGTYTFTKEAREPWEEDETTVVTITDGKVVSVIRTFDGNQMKFYPVD